eukprot:4148331-Pleurochrysis_carterae.AAC.3
MSLPYGRYNCLHSASDGSTRHAWIRYNRTRVSGGSSVSVRVTQEGFTERFRLSLKNCDERLSTMRSLSRFAAAAAEKARSAHQSLPSSSVTPAARKNAARSGFVEA